MSDAQKPHDYSSTLALPVNRMPMKASPSELEPRLLAEWSRSPEVDQAASAAPRPTFVLHDGPPYANGHLHIGHAMNKVLKDVMVRSHAMMGYDASFVPGWDCHGLPIEWKVEENLREQGLSKDDVPVVEFRALCRAFASKWVSVQAAEFSRLGVRADFDAPYTTMAFKAEATIAAELMKLVESGQVYRGSKPVMWSVVERTALAEAEVEHRDYVSDAVWVKFPVREGPADLMSSHVVVWTTTPWTLPANRAVAYSERGSYGLYEVVSADRDFGPRPGERFLLSDTLSDAVAGASRLALARVRSVGHDELAALVCRHPLHGLGYGFKVPMLPATHVTHDAGTGFVHTAPGHGTDDFDVWSRNAPALAKMGYDTSVPFTVDDAGYLTNVAHGFGPSSENGAARVFDDRGEKGDANERVVSALINADVLVARARHKHSYPHSWRSKKPVLFRNTPQWFVHMDKTLADGSTLRQRGLAAVDETEFVPASGRNRLKGMVATRPDWVLSRQRRWGVPVTVFHDDEGVVLVDPVANAKVVSAFEAEGSDVWFLDGAKDRFLSHRDDTERWTMVTDVLDVWFDSGCTHAFVLEDRGDGTPPADVYFEGSDQHRGWFMSSLLESCSTRGKAPYAKVVTHGFVMSEDGTKMSKSAGATLSPLAVVKQYGADVLRLWAVNSDYREDLRVGPAALKATAEAYRKMRNTLRWMTGMVAHHDSSGLDLATMPELERYMLHRLAELSVEVRTGYLAFDFKRVSRLLSDFMNVELSSFYFMVRKDALYCDAPSSQRRRASLSVLDEMLRRLTTWLAPMLPFLAEEVWTSAYAGAGSVHSVDFGPDHTNWLDRDLAGRWKSVLSARSAVNAALEVARKGGLIGSSLEASVSVYVDHASMLETLQAADFGSLCIVSGLRFHAHSDPDDATRSEDTPWLSVIVAKAAGSKCARSWVVSDDVGSDPDYPHVSARDAAVLRELAEARRA